jgi:hypothetical protein
MLVIVILMLCRIIIVFGVIMKFRIVIIIIHYCVNPLKI